MKKVALVTYGGLPNLSDDDRPLLTCLAEHGLLAEAVTWDANGVNWNHFDSIVLRSCWDYHHRAHEFSAWIDALDEGRCPLWNPTPIVRWNMHKSYLRDLQGMGANIAPTVWVQEGRPMQLSAILEEKGWHKAVVKPTISASAHRTWLVSAEDAKAKQLAFEEMVATSSVMVQKFIDDILVNGEWSFIFFNSGYSHSVLKLPGAGDFRVQSEFGGFLGSQTAPAPLIDQAVSIIDLLGTRILYARVDAVDVQGRLLLMELELIEPHLFLHQHPMAVQRLTEAIISTLR